MRRPNAGQTTIETRGERGATRLALVVMGGGILSARPLPTSGRVTIGRSTDCDLRIDHGSVSRLHAVLHVGVELELEDYDSKNGTRVGGERLAAHVRTRIAPGQPFEVGDLTLLVRPTSENLVRASEIEPDAALVIADPQTRALFELVERVAAGDIHVIVLGETGVGKERVAEAIHARSPRAAKPFLALNCAALPEAMLESELFGHERGAFTGAQAAKPGLFEVADGGTVFLDEVVELPLSMQAKLLRVIEEQSVRRLGGLDTRPARIRFVAAANREIEAEVEAGRFRRDLLFRLNGVTLRVPPLRQRPLDIAPLANSFLERAAARFGRPPPRLSTEALQLLMVGSWPGNVRELKNVIERAVLLSSGAEIRVEHLSQPTPEIATRPTDPPPRLEPTAQDASEPEPESSLRRGIEQYERARIIEVLEECAGNQTRAAQRLGISRRALLLRLDAYGVPRPRKRRS